MLLKLATTIESITVTTSNSAEAAFLVALSLNCEVFSADSL
jgi:hypothetical protein